MFVPGRLDETQIGELVAAFGPERPRIGFPGPRLARQRSSAWPGSPTAPSQRVALTALAELVEEIYAAVAPRRAPGNTWSRPVRSCGCWGRKRAAATCNAELLTLNTWHAGHSASTTPRYRGDAPGPPFIWGAWISTAAQGFSGSW